MELLRRASLETQVVACTTRLRAAFRILPVLEGDSGRRSLAAIRTASNERWSVRKHADAALLFCYAERG